MRASLSGNIFAGICIAYVLFWNVTTVTDLDVPPLLNPLGQVAGLKQSWDMFSPRPVRVTTWFVIPGTLASGEQVDLIRPALFGDVRLVTALSSDRPQDFAAVHKDKYWRKYLSAIRDERDERRAFAAYICRSWNGVHEGQFELVELEIVYVRERTLPDLQREPPDRDVLSQHECD